MQTQNLEDAVVESASSPLCQRTASLLGVADGREVGNLRIGVGQEAERDIPEFEVIPFKVPSKLAVGSP